MLSGNENVLSLCVWKCSWFLVCLGVQKSWMVQVSSALTAVIKTQICFYYNVYSCLFYFIVIGSHITTYQI